MAQKRLTRAQFLERLLGSRVMVEERDKQRAEILLSRLALQIREETDEAD